MARYKLSERLPRKRAFITGAGSGLGRQFSLELAGDGWILGLADFNKRSLAETTELVQAAGGTPHSFVFDVSDRKAYQRNAKRFLKTAGGLDLLINNAGVGDGGDVGEYSLENWEWLIGINVMGVVHGCHFFLDSLKSQGGGHIINMSSAAAYSNLPSMSAYSATKAAVLSLSEVLDSELAPHGVGVSAVTPTFIQTNIMQHSRGRDEERSELTRLLLKTSGLTPQKVVPMILDQAGRGKLHIVFPFRARLARWMTRLAPWLWRRIKTRVFGDRQALIRKLQKIEAKRDRGA